MHRKGSLSIFYQKHNGRSELCFKYFECQVTKMSRRSSAAAPAYTVSEHITSQVVYWLGNAAKTRHTHRRMRYVQTRHTKVDQSSRAELSLNFVIARKVSVTKLRFFGTKEAKMILCESERQRRAKHYAKNHCHDVGEKEWAKCACKSFPWKIKLFED